ncbi:MYND-type domain-containing protein [Mycena kentingensis (nom. inval.)]|nr:MYND-type domain-containing protein [Mycena kentingensis (nom. inval.)]
MPPPNAAPPKISNVEVTHIPGFDNPMTSFTINPNPDADSGSEGEEEDAGEQKAKMKKKHRWADMPFINNAGDGYGAFPTTFGQIAARIPDKPSLKKSCEACGRRAEQTGSGFAACAACKVARYCSKDCQTGHWKEHRVLCKIRRAAVDKEKALETKALAENKVFVSQATLRQWYYDNVGVLDYAVAQILQLYSGKSNTLWRTHAAALNIRGGKPGTVATADELALHEGDPHSLLAITRASSFGVSPVLVQALQPGKRIILVLVAGETVLVEGHDLPEDAEWAALEKDEMWRMHVRMRKFAKEIVAKDEEEEETKTEN